VVPPFLLLLSYRFGNLIFHRFIVFFGACFAVRTFPKLASAGLLITFTHVIIVFLKSEKMLVSGRQKYQNHAPGAGFLSGCWWQVSKFSLQKLECCGATFPRDIFFTLHRLFPKGKENATHTATSLHKNTKTA
jgi:hypothetical protein